MRRRPVLGGTVRTVVARPGAGEPAAAGGGRGEMRVVGKTAGPSDVGSASSSSMSEETRSGTPMPSSVENVRGVSSSSPLASATVFLVHDRHRVGAVPSASSVVFFR